METLRNIVDGYHDLMLKKDPRVDDWFLMSSPFYTLGICAFYIYFVKSLGPRFMRDRKPMDLKAAIIVYNFIQVVASIFLIYKGLVHAWLWKYSLRCQPVDYSDDPDEVAVAHMCWWYFFCKLTEFMDTIFFVLRKKNDQITNLHVIHHTMMPAACWWGVKFAPGGHGTFFGMLNTFVHVIMYSYYLVAAMGPQYQKYLWWKKYLTTMQMVQFVIVFLHTVQLFFIDCNFPIIIAYAMCFNSIMFMTLFTNFYIQAYIKRRRLPKIKDEDVTETKSAKDKDAGFISDVAGNFFSKATSTCYIGQNGLQSEEKGSPNGKSKKQKPAAYGAARQRNVAKEDQGDIIRWTPT